MSNILKINAAAAILGGEAFYATSEGKDPENPNVNDLLANGLYIRIKGDDNSVAYIDAFEIDKALGIIGQMSMSKADKADLDEVEETINGLATKTELQLLSSNLDGKAAKTDLDTVSDALITKASQTDVDALTTAVSTKAEAADLETLTTAVSTKAEAADLETLTTAVSTKAEAADLEDIIADITTLQETVRTLTNADSIANINAQILHLSNELQRRLTIDDLSSINASINTINSTIGTYNDKFSEIDANLNKKATTTYVQGQVNELNTAITGLATQMPNKADKETVAKKANKTEVDTLTSTVSSINTKVAGLEVSLDEINDIIETELDKKVDAATLNNRFDAIDTALASTVSRTAFANTTSDINRRLDNLLKDHGDDISQLYSIIEGVDHTTTASLSELRALSNTQSQSLTKQDNEIKRLKETSATQTDQLKQPWVRVLSSNEYKKLTTPPEGVPYNSRYKYPNVLYMVVDFNKPKAIYIGSILIAQAEQKGSVGFAYTFPIIF